MPLSDLFLTGMVALLFRQTLLRLFAL